MVSAVQQPGFSCGMLGTRLTSRQLPQLCATRQALSAAAHLALRELHLVLAPLPGGLCRCAPGHQVDQPAVAMRQDEAICTPLNRAVGVPVGGGRRKAASGSDQARTAQQYLDQLGADTAPSTR